MPARGCPAGTGTLWTRGKGVAGITDRAATRSLAHEDHVGRLVPGSEFGGPADRNGSGAPARLKWKRSFDFNSQLIDCERQVAKVNPSFPMSNSG